MTLTIAELDAQLRKIKCPPYGFFVSQATHDHIVERWRASAPALIGGATLPATYAGLQIAVDPRLPDNEMLLAQTEAAWREHLAGIRPAPRFIACVGEFATREGIGTDLECDARDRRLVIARSDDDAIRKLRGMRGHGSGFRRHERELVSTRAVPAARVSQGLDRGGAPAAQISPGKDSHTMTQPRPGDQAPQIPTTGSGMTPPQLEPGREAPTVKVTLSRNIIIDRLRKLQSDLHDENRHTDALIVEIAIQAIEQPERILRT